MTDQKRKINMKDTTTDFNLNRRNAVGASACRNNLTALGGGAIGTNLPPAESSRAGETSPADFADEAECQPLTLWANSSAARELIPGPVLPWRSALLREEAGSLAEKCIYFVLAAAAAASLLMAFWQLHSLEAGWASFVEMVNRFVS